jgi:hypothetical protein
MQGVVFDCLEVRSGQPATSRLPDSDLKLAAALAASSSLPVVQTTRQTPQPHRTPKQTHNLPHKSLSTQTPQAPIKMSGAAQGSASTTKAVTSDSKDTSQPLQPQKPGAQLEEDDEFEDFPVEGMYHHITSHHIQVKARRLSAHILDQDANMRYHQTGPRTRKSDHRLAPRICGRKAGTTMIRATTSRCS